MPLDTFQKAARMQAAATELTQSYGAESTDTDAYRAALQFEVGLHSLSNASLARLFDILTKETAQ